MLTNQSENTFAVKSREFLQGATMFKKLGRRFASTAAAAAVISTAAWAPQSAVAGPILDNIK